MRCVRVVTFAVAAPVANVVVIVVVACGGGHKRRRPVYPNHGAAHRHNATRSNRVGLCAEQPPHQPHSHRKRRGKNICTSFGINCTVVFAVRTFIEDVRRTTSTASCWRCTSANRSLLAAVMESLNVPLAPTPGIAGITGTVWVGGDDNNATDDDTDDDGDDTDDDGDDVLFALAISPAPAAASAADDDDDDDDVGALASPPASPAEAALLPVVPNRPVHNDSGTKLPTLPSPTADSARRYWRSRRPLPSRLGLNARRTARRRSQPRGVRTTVVPNHLLVGWLLLVGLVGWLVSGLVGWLVGWLVSWFG